MSTIYYDRTTSSGYRFPPVQARPHTTIGVRTRPSGGSPPLAPGLLDSRGGRETIIGRTKSSQRRTIPASGIRPTTAMPTIADPVAKDKICTETILNWKRRDGIWETHWGFTLDLDPKGEPKPRRQLPEKASVYSSDLPNTDSGNYGSQLNTDIGRRLQNLETRFYSANKKRKIGSDLICY